MSDCGVFGTFDQWIMFVSVAVVVIITFGTIRGQVLSATSFKVGVLVYLPKFQMSSDP